MNSSKILCSISTRGRYHTTLPLAINAVINQSKKIDKLIIFDDNTDRIDVRELTQYRRLFEMMDIKGIKWECIFGQCKGQHFNHHIANTQRDYEWVWRVDDDCIPEYDTLENLSRFISSDVGAIGGSILTPPILQSTKGITGNIEHISSEPNMQWGLIDQVKNVDHLHCSFLYRSGVYDYNLGLSKVAHREETLFTYGLKQRGYKVLVVPDAVTWHMKAESGGIRDGVKELYERDDFIFGNFIKYKDSTIVVLDCGMGDHIVFKHVLPDIKNPIVFTCHPDIIPGRPIGEASYLFGDIGQWNIYGKMDQWQWKESLESAYRKLYL